MRWRSPRLQAEDQLSRDPSAFHLFPKSALRYAALDDARVRRETRAPHSAVIEGEFDRARRHRTLSRTRSRQRRAGWPDLNALARLGPAGQRGSPQISARGDLISARSVGGFPGSFRRSLEISSRSDPPSRPKDRRIPTETRRSCPISSSPDQIRFRSGAGFPRISSRLPQILGRSDPPASQSDHRISRRKSQIVGHLEVTRSPRPRSGSRNSRGNSQILLDHHAERSDRIPPKWRKSWGFSQILHRPDLPQPI